MIYLLALVLMTGCQKANLVAATSTKMITEEQLRQVAKENKEKKEAHLSQVQTIVKKWANENKPVTKQSLDIYQRSNNNAIVDLICPEDEGSSEGDPPVSTLSTVMLELKSNTIKITLIYRGMADPNDEEGYRSKSYKEGYIEL